MEVTYLDHSGFIVSTPRAFLVFDYYKDPNHDLERVIDRDKTRPVIFFVSHHHPDHFNTSIFELCQNRERLYVLSNDIFPKLVPKTGLQVAWMSAGDVIDSLPGDITVKAYGSTDVGVSYLVTLKDGRRIFHAGDLNDWHWSEESTPREAARAEEKFRVIVQRIGREVPSVDIAMFPVDTRLGDGCARGATIFLETVKVANFFPMHFFGEPRKACDFPSYLPAGSTTRCYCLSTPGQWVEIS